MGTRLRAWMIVALWLSGCDNGGGTVEECIAVCQACSLGYCGGVTGGGESGWCYDATRRPCILAHADDCSVAGVISCVMGPEIPLPDGGT